MSAFTRAFLFCNGCGNSFSSDTVPSEKSISEVRREAKRAGWTRKRDGRDFCPDCTEGTEES